MKQRKGTCPQCGQAAIRSRDNPWRPFCSERCRLIDLGAWLDESHRIPTGEPTSDFPDADPDDVSRH